MNFNVKYYPYCLIRQKNHLMGVEIEHKYLVIDQCYETMAERSVHMEQGYLCREPRATVRVRIAGDKAFLTVKGKNKGAVRPEFEYEIPVDDARVMLDNLCDGVLSKRRYFVPFKGFVWEVDRFDSPLEGLILAEIELPSAATRYELPPFVGADVTSDPRYYNSNLCKSGVRPS